MVNPVRPGKSPVAKPLENDLNTLCVGFKYVLGPTPGWAFPMVAATPHGTSGSSTDRGDFLIKELLPIPFQ